MVLTVATSRRHIPLGSTVSRFKATSREKSRFVGQRVKLQNSLKIQTSGHDPSRFDMSFFSLNAVG